MTRDVFSGWTTDPYRRYQQRFWDGRQWTAHVANGHLSGEDPIDHQLPKPVEAYTPEEWELRRRQEAARRAAWWRKARPYIAIAIAIVLILGGLAYYRANYTCSGLRDHLGNAKAARGLGGGTDDERRAVDDAARRARQRGCNIDDLIGDNVGQ